MKHILAAFILSIALAAPAMAQAPSETVSIISGGKTHSFKVDLAETKAAAELGLAGRAELAKDQGLLVDYKKVGQPLTPTMHGVKMDLDFLFMAPDGTVVSMIQYARAGSERPLWTGLGAVAALEIPAGQVAALGLKPGDKVKAKAFGNAG